MLFEKTNSHLISTKKYFTSLLHTCAVLLVISKWTSFSWLLLDFSFSTCSKIAHRLGTDQSFSHLRLTSSHCGFLGHSHFRIPYVHSSAYNVLSKLIQSASSSHSRSPNDLNLHLHHDRRRCRTACSMDVAVHTIKSTPSLSVLSQMIPVKRWKIGLDHSEQSVLVPVSWQWI